MGDRRGRPRQWETAAAKQRDYRQRQATKGALLGDLLHAVRNAHFDEPELAAVVLDGEDTDVLRALIAYYRAADIALITPLKDGMNLVAKEYCACSIEEDCVLILSEFAGAAAQLQRGALLVNPYDIEGVADTLRRAFTMSEDERRARMRRLRRSIRESDIFWWVDSFLRAAIAKDLTAFPQPEGVVPEAVPDYVPI